MSNTYVNKVNLADGTTLIDISDTTAIAGDVARGKYFYTANGAKVQGTYFLPAWELINEATFTNATEADYTITTDSDSEAFELTDVCLFFETPEQQTDAEKGNNGQVYFIMNNDDDVYIMTESRGWEQAAGDDAHSFTVLGQQMGDLMNFGAGVFFTTDIKETYELNELYFTKINIKAVTGTGHYILYGKRR